MRKLLRKLGFWLLNVTDKDNDIDIALGTESELQGDEEHTWLILFLGKRDARSGRRLMSIIIYYGDENLGKRICNGKGIEDYLLYSFAQLIAKATTAYALRGVASVYKYKNSTK